MERADVIILGAGAAGYLLKDTERDTLLNTIRAAARGESLFKPEILQRAFAKQAATPPPPSKAVPVPT